MKFVLFGGSRPVVLRAVEWMRQRGFELTAVVASEPGPDLQTLLAGLNLPLLDYDRLLQAARDGFFPGDYRFAAEADVFLSFMFQRKFKEPLISMPPGGCFNFHPAPLPDYRGVGCYCRGLLDRVSRWGVSFHRIDRGIDTGDLIEVLRFDIDPDEETSLSLQRRSMLKMEELFQRLVPLIDSGRLPEARPQDQAAGTYTSLSDLAALKKVSADDSAEETARKIRAFWSPPNLGAHVEIGGQKFTLVSEFILKQLAEGS